MAESTNPAGWPEQAIPVFQRAITCEYASLTRAGGPVTWPLNPYLGEDGRTIDVSTGLTYPSKAERARRNPNVALLFSDPVGSGLKDFPVVLVLGQATVRDSDLQANTDRYVRLGLTRFREAYGGQPAFLLRMATWYFTRMWILVTPLRILWWPGGDMDSQPHVWEAPEGTIAPPSDPAPGGKSLGPWQKSPGGWRQAAEHSARSHGAPVLTVAGDDGYPYPLRMKGARLEAEGFALEVPAGVPAAARLEGPACLTFHIHGEVFTGQENSTFMGEMLRRADGGAFFKVERLLPDFSLPGSRLSATAAMLSAAVKLAPRLKREAQRRGQLVPRVNLPLDR